MNTIKRNLGWLLVSQAATWGVSILVLLVTPRKLGDEAFGRLMFAAVYVSFFALVALFGSGAFLAKTIARDTSAMATYVLNTLLMKLVLTGFLIAVALGLAVVAGFDRETTLLIGVCCIGMLFDSLNSVLVGGLAGMQQMKRPALWDIARSYVGGVLGIAVLLRGGSLLAFALVTNLAQAIPLVANGLHLLPRLRKRGRIELGLWRQILVGGFPFFIWSALLVVYGTIDIPLVQAFSGSEAVGWYTVAYRWVSMPAFFAVMVATAFFPALSADSVHLSHEFVRKANRALHLVVLVATPAALGIALTAKGFVSLVYGAQFHQAVPLMEILALHIPIVGMDVILGSVIVAADHQRQWVMVGVAAAIFNPLLNLAAIPLSQRLFGNAAIGAAAVTVLTELLLMVGAIRLRPQGVLDRATTQILLRVVIASVAMAPVVLALRPTPLIVQVVAGGLVYGAASLALGTISLHDVRSWAHSFGRERQPRDVNSISSAVGAD